MPDDTVVEARLSAANFARVVEALTGRRDDLVGEDGTDRELYVAWLRGVHTALVNKDERRAAQGVIAPDTGIAEVT